MEPLMKAEVDLYADLPEELDVFARLSRFGRFREAREVYSEVLSDRGEEFPVIAEYADFLLEQDHVQNLREFLLNKFDTGGRHLREDELQLLQLLETLCDFHLGAPLPDFQLSLLRAQKVASERYREASLSTEGDNSNKDDFSDVDVELQIGITALRILHLADTANSLVTSDKQPPWIGRPVDSKRLPWDGFTEWIKQLQEVGRLWEAKEILEILLEVLDAGRATATFKSFIDAVDGRSTQPELLAAIAGIDAYCKYLIRIISQLSVRSQSSRREFADECRSWMDLAQKKLDVLRKDEEEIYDLRPGLRWALRKWDLNYIEGERDSFSLAHGLACAEKQQDLKMQEVFKSRLRIHEPKPEAADFGVYYPPLFHTHSELGAVQVQGAPRVQFRLFFPACGYTHDPRIASVQVAGDFQSKISYGNDWNFDSLHLTRSSAPGGQGDFWTLLLEADLPPGFYEYKYRVTFEDPSKHAREVTDPFARYSGRKQQNSGFVISGSTSFQHMVTELPKRKPLSDLVIYEMHIGDFTDEFCGSRAPFEAVSDKLDYLQSLGINAILFMPWTASKDKDYDWGYAPFQYFAVEYAYANNDSMPEEKTSWLKRLISDCHKRDIHVIMDGVFNHCDPAFPYRKFYSDEAECPYTEKTFGDVFPGLQDLDFNNNCTQAFIRDVCLYWVSEFKIDGIRFDNSVNFYLSNDLRGLPALLQSIQDYLASNGERNFSMTIEHLNVAAAYVVNSTAATSYWDNGLHMECFEHLQSGRISANYLAVLNNTKYVDDPAKTATIYLSNHDHSAVAWQAGILSDGRSRWYRTQPHMIALLTSPGTPLIPMGQEFAEDYFIPENDEGSGGRRIRPRPLHWKDSSAGYGQVLLYWYKKLIRIRHEHPALRSRNFEPSGWERWMTSMNDEGCGVDTAHNIVVYRRTSDIGDETFQIALNFSEGDLQWELTFPEDGYWDDLLNESRVEVARKSATVTLTSNWGRVFFKRSA